MQRWLEDPLRSICRADRRQEIARRRVREDLDRSTLGASSMTVMTDADRQRIEQLAEKKFSVGRIAQLIGRHKSTVNWYMYCNGLRAPKKLERAITYVRGGVRVHRFTDEEDVFIEALRIQGCTPEAIAGHASVRFGTERKHHSIRCRLKMLAARDLQEETE
jgi:hypothetical protein